MIGKEEAHRKSYFKEIHLKMILLHKSIKNWGRREKRLKMQ